MNLTIQTVLGEIIITIESDMDEKTFKTIYYGTSNDPRLAVVQADSVEQVIENIHLNAQTIKNYEK